MKMIGLLARLSPRTGFGVVGLSCVGLVASGLVLQEMLRLSPCPLCIFQRVLYLTVGLLGGLGFLWPAARLLWALLMAGIGALGVGVAGYQSWMQAFPELVNECGFSEPSLIERFVDLLGMQWPSLFLATGFCTSKEWVFLGLSMANWSLVLFLGILAVAVRFFRQRA